MQTVSMEEVLVSGFVNAVLISLLLGPLIIGFCLRWSDPDKKTAYKVSAVAKGSFYMGLIFPFIDFLGRILLGNPLPSLYEFYQIGKFSFFACSWVALTLWLGYQFKPIVWLKKWDERES